MSDKLEMPEAVAEIDDLSPDAEASFHRTRPRRGVEEADRFLRAVVRMGASDMHLKSGQAPRLRINGALKRVDREAAPTELFEARVLAFLTDDERQTLLRNGSVDFAYDLDGEVRFRMNVFRQESGISMVARVVPRHIPSFDDLRLPPIVESLAEVKQGLVLVSGMTGSGKSTTIAAMIQKINETRQEHILTIEDPIEFLFESKQSLVNQREVGINVTDFSTALRAMLREDPDVVLIGEMRDAETFRAALQAADTGHLVFSTVHAASAAQTISRLLNMFPQDEQPSVRQSLTYGVKGIISQKLLRSTAEGVNRVPAVEVLLSTPIVRKLIAEEREAELGDIVRRGDDGMICFSESLVNLHKQGLIDEQTGIAAAPNPDEFQRMLAGIHVS